MKKRIRIVLTAMLLSVICAAPCMAKEYVNPLPELTEAQMIAKLNAHKEDAQKGLAYAITVMHSPAEVQAHTEMVNRQVNAYIWTEIDTYLSYRAQRLASLRECEEMHKKNYEYIESMAQISPAQYRQAADTAKANYLAASNNRAAEETDIQKCITDFNTLYPR